MCGQVNTNFRGVDFEIAYTREIAFHDYGEAIVMPKFSYGKEFSRLGPLCSSNDMVSHTKKTIENGSSALLSPRPSSLAGDTANCSHIVTHTDERHVTRHGNIDLATDTQDKEEIMHLRALVSDLGILNLLPVINAAIATD